MHEQQLSNGNPLGGIHCGLVTNNQTSGSVLFALLSMRACTCIVICMNPCSILDFELAEENCINDITFLFFTPQNYLNSTELFEFPR